VDDVFLPDAHPSKAFIAGAIDKEIRLSFAQRIKNTLPEPYKVMITPEKEKETPDFKFANDGEWRTVILVASEANKFRRTLCSRRTRDRRPA
jgi:hypothetical protein